MYDVFKDNGFGAAATGAIVFDVSCTLLLQLPSSITSCGAACFATYRCVLLWIYAYVRGISNGLSFAY